MSTVLGKLIIYTTPGLLLGFVLGYLAKTYMDEEKAEQARLFAYMLITMWMYLVMMQAGSVIVESLPKVKVPYAVHALVAVPIGYVFDVDIQNIWAS